MKTMLVAMAMVAGITGTAHAGGTATLAEARGRSVLSCDQHGATLVCAAPHARRAAPTTMPASLNDQGRAQLNRLIASL